MRYIFYNANIGCTLYMKLNFININNIVKLKKMILNLQFINYYFDNKF